VRYRSSPLTIATRKLFKHIGPPPPFNYTNASPFEADLGDFESPLHEIAHIALLDFDGLGSRDESISFRLSFGSFIASRRNEVQTLAVEILVARQFDLELDDEVLAQYAWENIDDYYKSVESVVQEIQRIHLHCPKCHAIANEIAGMIRRLM
jgi:hypothetical protein